MTIRKQMLYEMMEELIIGIGKIAYQGVNCRYGIYHLYLGNCQGGAPLFFQDIKANATIAVNIGMKNFCSECYLQNTTKKCLLQDPAHTKRRKRRHGLHPQVLGWLVHLKLIQGILLDFNTIIFIEHFQHLTASF